MLPWEVIRGMRGIPSTFSGAILIGTVAQFLAVDHVNELQQLLAHFWDVVFFG